MSQSENTPGKPEFKQLWPTQFMSLSLPGHDTANPVLADHLLEQNIARDDMTVDYTSDNLFMTDHPAVIWLRQCCDRAVLDYARHAGIDYDLEWILQGWANVNMRGDYHNLHNHPHSWLSGTYYVSVPDQSDADTFRSDLNPSAISFFDPRPQANVLLPDIKDATPFNSHTYAVTPEPGQMIIFPSWLAHRVAINRSKQERISLSFNVMLQGAYGFDRAYA